MNALVLISILERENGAVLIQPEDINVLSLKQPFEASVYKVVNSNM